MIIKKIQDAYEELPFWLKPGIQDDNWNKHTAAFDNKSRIIARSTTETAGRGLAISLLYCDELAFVKPHIQQKFWNSVFPTLSTGGGCIISSTPNGDTNLFATLWRGAEDHSANAVIGPNGFYATRVFWDQPPGRDQKYKDETIATLGEHTWMQEYECLGGGAYICIEDEFGVVYSLTMEQLYKSLKNGKLSVIQQKQHY